SLQPSALSRYLLPVGPMAPGSVSRSPGPSGPPTGDTEMTRKASLTALVLSLAFAATATVPVRAEDDKRPAGSFRGLVHDKSVDKLVKPIDGRGDASALRLSVIGDAKAFQAFTDAAGLKKAPFDVDWDKQAVVVVVLKAHTNRLIFKDWTAKGDVGQLVF